MLNLSDKELDRLSKDAAQEYEPGDILGERSWERLEMRLDRDLGHHSPNPLRHIRRYPFYYAPALLVLIGVTYYVARQGTKGTGGPPGTSGIATPTATVKNISSSKNPGYTDKLNSTPAATTNASASPAAADSKGSSLDASTSTEGSSTDKTAGSLAGSTKNNVAGAAAAGGSVGSATTGGSASVSEGNSAAASSTVKTTSTIKNGQKRANQPAISLSGNKDHRTNNHRDHRSNSPGPDERSVNSLAANELNLDEGSNGQASAANPASRQVVQVVVIPHLELTKSSIQGLTPIKKAPYIDDSALRHFTLKGPLAHNKGVHINRTLQFGALVAPDFASVNALSGDKAGSTLGLTVDYQFANNWYIGTGLLVDRKNYAARPQDFHEPVGNGPGAVPPTIAQGMQYVKGSFGMLEIPLNLRYDFSVTGNTLFFASGGVSSYLFTNESNGIYFVNFFNYRQISCQQQQNPKSSSYLFSSFHFSLGVETGLSNSMSLLIAPYAELPMRGIGLGQVQMSSVGINFSLKFAPVISRKRY